MSVIYQTTIVEIGDSASDALLDNMMITFKQGAPADIVEFCFIHNHSESCGELIVGSQLQIGDASYPVTAVGDVATQNLRELGHVTIRFDGASEAEFPGTVHINGTTPQEITAGTEFKFIN